MRVRTPKHPAARVLAIGALLVPLAGCRRPAEPAGSEPAPRKEPGIVETMTGAVQIEAGKRAGEKVRRIGEEHQKDLDRILNEE